MILVAFEGLSGSGKSTAIQALTKYFRSKKYKVGVTEINNARDFKNLRAIEKKYHILHPLSNLLFLVLRMQQGVEIQKMKEREYDIVFADRYSGSSRAFMACSGFPEEFIFWVKENIHPHPDITFLFKIPSQVARKRKYSRSLEEINGKKRKMIEKKLDTFAIQHKWNIIDATDNPDSVQDICRKIIERHSKFKKIRHT